MLLFIPIASTVLISNLYSERMFLVAIEYRILYSTSRTVQINNCTETKMHKDANELAATEFLCCFDGMDSALDC